MGSKNYGTYTTIALAIALSFRMSPAFADPCDVLGFDLSQATNASVERKANMLNLKHPWVDAAGVSYCATKPGFSASVETAFPKGTFFEFIGEAGSIVVKTPAETLRKVASKCARLALKDPDGLHHLSASGLEFTCNVKSGPNAFATVLIDRKLAQ